jgi:hypothetical protein
MEIEIGNQDLRTWLMKQENGFLQVRAIEIFK